jgi:predicted RNA-binding protein with PIN domain
VERHQEEILDYHNIHVVFTRKAQTADHYIERFAHDNQEKYHITVATSDNLQQVIIRGAGCTVWSATDLLEEIERTNKGILQTYQDEQSLERNYLKDKLSQEAKERMESLIRDGEQN